MDFIIQLIALGLGIAMAVALWKLMRRMGQPGWSIFIPGYNFWCFFKAAGVPNAFWLLCVPMLCLGVFLASLSVPALDIISSFTFSATIYSIVFIAYPAYAYASYKVARAFGRGWVLAAALTCLPPVGIGYLAIKHNLEYAPVNLTQDDSSEHLKRLSICVALGLAMGLFTGVFSLLGAYDVYKATIQESAEVRTTSTSATPAASAPVTTTTRQTKTVVQYENSKGEKSSVVTSTATTEVRTTFTIDKSNIQDLAFAYSAGKKQLLIKLYNQPLPHELKKKIIASEKVASLMPSLGEMAEVIVDYAEPVTNFDGAPIAKVQLLVARQFWIPGDTKGTRYTLDASDLRITGSPTQPQDGYEIILLKKLAPTPAKEGLNVVIGVRL